MQFIMELPCPIINYSIETFNNGDDMAGLTLTNVFKFVKFMIDGQQAVVPTKEAVEELGKYLNDKIDNIDLPEEVKSREFLSGARADYVEAVAQDGDTPATPATTRITFAVKSVMGTAGTPITVDLPAASLIEVAWDIGEDD